MKTIDNVAGKPAQACPDLLPTTKERIKGAFIAPTAAVSLRGKLWKNGETITVSFEDHMRVGGSQLITRVKKHIQHVFGLTGLKLKFVPGGQGTIRISFTRGGSWSYLGTDAKLIPKNKHTMQLGWLEQSTNESEVQRVVRHEFLHALAVGHEQASPNARIPWDKPKVYDHYRRTQGWDRAQVDAQVFQRYDEGQVAFTEFDRDSIMLYPVPNSLTIGDFEIGMNRDLSKLDVEHLQSVYPKPTSDGRLEKLRQARRRILLRIQKRRAGKENHRRAIRKLAEANKEDRARLDRVNKAIGRIS